MADRKDYYFKQIVSEAELDAGFEGLEQADWDLVVDTDRAGVKSGIEVSADSLGAAEEVDISTGVAYSKQGERIHVDTAQGLDISTDDGGSNTAVGASGNEKWVSIFLEFDRDLSDSRTDGNGTTVFFDRAESFKFSVVQESEASAGNAVRPALDPNKILLADIKREFGTSVIPNNAIDIGRRETTYRHPESESFDTYNTLTTYNFHRDKELMGNHLDQSTINVGTTKSAIEKILKYLNYHADDEGHDASGITVQDDSTLEWHGSENLLDGSSNEDLQITLQNLVSDLAEVHDVSGGTGGGADRVGGISYSPTGETYALLSGSVSDNLQKLLDILNSFSSGIDIDQDVDVGGSYVGSGQHANPRIIARVAQDLTARYTNVIETDDGVAEAESRLYMSSTGQVISVNRSYDNLNDDWEVDDSSDESTIIFIRNNSVLETFHRAGSADLAAEASSPARFLRELAQGSTINDDHVRIIARGLLSFEGGTGDAWFDPPHTEDIRGGGGGPGLNVYAKSIIKSWGSVQTDGAGGAIVLDGLNISSVSVPSAGILQIDFVRGFVNTNYSFTAIVASTTGAEDSVFVRTDTKNLNSVKLRVKDSDGGTNEALNNKSVTIDFMAIGTSS